MRNIKKYCEGVEISLFKFLTTIVNIKTFQFSIDVYTRNIIQQLTPRMSIYCSKFELHREMQFLQGQEYNYHLRDIYIYLFILSSIPC